MHDDDLENLINFKCDNPLTSSINDSKVEAKRSC